jgi:hypothetical protein
MLRLRASEDPGRAARARMNRILIVYVTRPQIAVLGWSTQAPPMAPRPQVQN